MEKRVVITGLGAITPIGNNVDETWKGIENKECGIDKISLFDSSNFKTLITLNNKRESTENKYYVVAVNEFKEWNIDVLENKPSGW